MQPHPPAPSGAPRPLASSVPTPESAKLDGRRQRSADSRARIVAAMLELTREGCVSVSAEQVAARAEVGLRTVFRLFKDMDSLYREMSLIVEAEVRKAIILPYRTDHWRTRLDELIERRAQVFERIAPHKRAGAAHRHRSPFLEESHRAMVAELRGVLREVLPADIAEDREKFEILDLLMSFEAWSRLREEQGLGVEEARSLIVHAVAKLVDGSRAP